MLVSVPAATGSWLQIKMIRLYGYDIDIYQIVIGILFAFTHLTHNFFFFSLEYVLHHSCCIYYKTNK